MPGIADAAMRMLAGSPPPRSFVILSITVARILARAAGSFNRARIWASVPSIAHCGKSAEEMPVLDAVYGYWSIVTSTPRARAAATSASVSLLRSAPALPMILWWVIWLGSPPFSPIAIVSLTLSTILLASSRMCEM